MRAMLLLLALAAGAAAFYLADDRGAGDPAVIAVAAVAVFAVAMFRMSPSSARPKSRGPAPMSRTPAYREEASELAGNLDALAQARASRNEEALDSRNTVAVYLARVGENQIAVIKALRKHFNLDLKTAKDLTDSAKHGQKPSLGQTVPANLARALQADIAKAGGEVEIR